MSSDNIKRALEQMGLTISAKFIPFSQSQRRQDKRPSLNWDVDIFQNGRLVHSLPYVKAEGHTQAYKAPVKHLGHRSCIMRDDAIREECESGMYPRTYASRFYNKSPHTVDIVEVMHSVAVESAVLDHDSFESWAVEYGYDTDSREAEKIYNSCLKTALAFRAALGSDGLEKLFFLYRDH